MQCPVCQTEVPYDANFCLKCGHAFGEKKQPRKSSYITDAERKRFTALFFDLSGYTALSKKIDPEDVKKITSGIFDGVREVMAKYEGFIERFAGDGILALFGVPIGLIIPNIVSADFGY